MPTPPAFRRPSPSGSARARGSLFGFAVFTITLALWPAALSAQSKTYTNGEDNTSAVDAAGGIILTVNNTDIATQSGLISGTGMLTKSGAGMLTFTGANTYSGGTTISAGTLQLGNGGASGSILGNVTNHGTLTFNRSDDFTFGGVIGGSGGVVNDGNIIRLSAAQTFTGPLQINSGVIVLPTTVDAGLSASTVVTVASGARLDLAGRNQTIAGLAGAGAVYSFGSPGSTLTVAVPSQQTYDFAGILGFFADSQSFGLTKSGDGTQILSGANTYTGPTTINGGTLQSANQGALSSTSAIAVNNAGTTLALNYGGASDYTEAQATALLAKTTFGASTTTLAFDTTNAGGPATYGNALTMNAGFTKLGAGTLVLTAANTYSGATLIAAGTLQVGDGGAEGALPAGTAITNNGTLVFDLSGSATHGDIAGTGALTQQGSGTLTLTGTNTYTGTTTIDSGTLSLAGTLDGGGDIAISGSGVLSETATGVISGASSLTVGGSGTSILAGANTYTGATLILAGTLQVGDGGTNGSLPLASAITNVGALAFNRSDVVTQGVDFADSITGGGQIVQNGSGTLVLKGTNSASGVVNNGTVQLGDGANAATVQASAGANGADGMPDDALHIAYLSTRDGSAGGDGRSAFVVNSGGTVDLSSQTTIMGGAGGNGGYGASLSGASPRSPGSGGAGGAGGNAIVVNDGTLSPLPAPSTVTGGAGGNGGETGYLLLHGSPDETFINLSGGGGAGGAAVLFIPTSSWTSYGTLNGGAGGFANRGMGVPGSGDGGAGIIFSQGGSLANLGTITGGNGGQGAGNTLGLMIGAVEVGKPGANGGPGVVFGASGSLTNSGVVNGGSGGVGGVAANNPRGFNTAGRGGDGGTAVFFSADGSLINSGMINGGRGGVGGEIPNDTAEPNTGGRGGDGGTAVIFSAGGSLINSGTISGSLGGEGGIAGNPGASGSTGHGVLFSGGAGTLTNQSGGVINGSVSMGNYANSVTLETGSTINGDLDVNTHTGSTLTLTGSGTATYSEAVTGVTTLAGSLVKTGSGTWTIDQAFTYAGGTTITAGTLNLANTSGSALGTGSVTIESGASLTGSGAFTGALTVDAGGVLSPGNSAGLMTIGSGSVFNGTVIVQIGGLLRGIDFDAIDGDGDGEITFGGTLAVSLINGFNPVSGDSFDLFDFTTAVATFDTLNLPTLSSGLFWDTGDLYTSGTLTVAGTAVPEPSTVALIFGLCALAAGFFWRRRARPARRA